MRRAMPTMLWWFAAVVLWGAAGAAVAQVYPAKPIRFFVPYAPGGVGDITARMVAQKMSESMGQQVVIENRPGAGLIVATEAAAKADPDGYTVTLTGNGSALSVSLFKSLPFDVVNDFVHVSTIGYFDLAMLATADSKFSSVAEVIAFAKANPGKLNVGTINIGSTQHLAAELFKSMAGIEVQPVPFKASAAVVTALRSNDVQVAFEMLAPVIGQIRSNTLKPLAVTSNRRFVGLPGTPTLAESGVAGYQASSWNGISITARAPQPVVARLNKAIVAAIATPDVRQKMLDLGVEARASTPEQMRELMISEIAKWKAVIERARIPRQ